MVGGTSNRFTSTTSILPSLLESPIATEEGKLPVVIVGGSRNCPPCAHIIPASHNDTPTVHHKRRNILSPRSNCRLTQAAPDATATPRKRTLPAPPAAGQADTTRTRILS